MNSPTPALTIPALDVPVSISELGRITGLHHYEISTLMTEHGIAGQRIANATAINPAALDQLRPILVSFAARKAMKPAKPSLTARRSA